MKAFVINTFFTYTVHYNCAYTCIHELAYMASKRVNVNSVQVRGGAGEGGAGEGWGRKQHATLYSSSIPIQICKYMEEGWGGGLMFILTTMLSIP